MKKNFYPTDFNCVLVNKKLNLKETVFMFSRVHKKEQNISLEQSWSKRFISSNAEAKISPNSDIGHGFLFIQI